MSHSPPVLIVAGALVATLLASSFAAAKPSTSEERAERLVDLEPWCGGPKAFRPCVDEIIQVNREMDRRAAEAKKAGDPSLVGNLGLSLTGCALYCEIRHFPSGTPKDCKATIATFRREAQAQRYLWKTGLRNTLAEECGRF